MDIGIIGSGMIGATSARLFVEVGHRVAIAHLHEERLEATRLSLWVPRS